MALDKLKYTYQDPAKVSQLNVDEVLNVNTANATTVNSKAEVISPTALNVGLTLRSSDTPSTDLQQFRSSSNVLNSSINSAGQMSIGAPIFPLNNYNLFFSSLVATSATTANIYYSGGIQPVSVGQQIQILNASPAYFLGTWTVTSVTGNAAGWYFTISGSGFTPGGVNTGGGLFRVSAALSIRPINAHTTSLIIQADQSQQHNLVEFLSNATTRVASIEPSGLARFSGGVNVGSASLIGANIQEANQSGSVINLSGVTGNANNTGSVRIQGRFASQLPLILRGSAGGASPITTATANGTTVTYTAGNALFYTVGQQVTITGVVSTGNPSATAGAGFNLTNVTIAAANSGTFSVTNSLVDTYTSGGTFTSPTHYADLTQWQGADSSVVARVTAAGGAAFTANTVLSGGLLVQGNYGGTNTMSISNNQNIIGLTIKANSTQTANLMELRDGSNNIVTYFGPAGQIISGQTIGTSGYLYSVSPASFGSNGLNNTYQVQVVNGAAARIGLMVQGAASQSGNLTEWQNSSGTVLAKIDSAGNLTATNITDSGWINPSLSNSFVSGGVTPVYRLLQGVVYLAGNVNSGTPEATAFTLPVGYRPAVTTVITVQKFGTADFSYLTINTDGTVQPNHASAWLSGVSFPIG